MVYAYVPNFVYSVAAILAKNPNFCRFWTSAFSVFANWQQSDKVEHECTVHNYEPSPIQRHQNCFYTPNAFMAKSGAQTLTFKSVTDKSVTDRQKNSTFFGHPGGG